MEADRVVAIGTDPSTASTFDVGRLAARVLELEQAIDRHRVEVGQPTTSNCSADVRLWSVADEDRTWTAGMSCGETADA